VYVSTEQCLIVSLDLGKMQDGDRYCGLPIESGQSYGEW